MDKLKEKAISRMFAFPVDPENDGCPNYNEIISHPMDLSTVTKKLEEDQYKTVSEWKSDVELIWSNSVEYNKTNTLMKIITAEMQELFVELTRFVSDDANIDWVNKLQYLSENLKIATKPYETGTSSKTKQGNSTKGVKNSGSTKTKKKNASGNTSKKALSKSQMTKLNKQISSLNEGQLLNILEIIEEEEPSAVPADSSSLNININSLKQSTILAIKSHLDLLFHSKE